MMSREEVETVIDMMIRQGWKFYEYNDKGDPVFFRMMTGKAVSCTVDTGR